MDHGLYPVPVQGIQVGGGLVQQQGLESVGDQAGQGQALALVRGESGDRPAQHFSAEAQPIQDTGKLGVVFSGPGTWIAKVIADPVSPPMRFGREQPDPAAPLGGGNGRTGDTVDPDLARVRIQVGDGAQEQALSRTGGTGEEDQFAGYDLQIDRLQPLGPKAY